MPGESHGQRSLEGYSPRGLKESDTSEPLSLPRHGMIFKSKLNVIIMFSLNMKKKKRNLAFNLELLALETTDTYLFIISNRSKFKSTLFGRQR